MSKPKQDTVKPSPPSPEILKLLQAIASGESRRRDVKVTPEMALELLCGNIANRSLRPSHIAYLSTMMKDGKWQKGHPAAILIATDGEILDGQHRLYAVLDSERTVWMNICVPESKEMRQFVDIGIQRTLADVLTFHKEPSRNRLVAGLINFASQVATNSVTKLPPERAKAVFGKHAESFMWLADTFTTTSMGMKKMPILYAICEMYERDKAMALAFYLSFKSPDGAVQPARMLRDFALQNVGRAGQAVRIIEYRKALFCCRAALRGERVTRIQEASGWD